MSFTERPPTTIFEALDRGHRLQSMRTFAREQGATPRGLDAGNTAPTTRPQQQASGSQLQPLRVDPNSPPPEETNAIAQARWYQTPHMCHPRLSTPCPLCKEMQRPLRPPGKVGVSTAPPTKPPLGQSLVGLSLRYNTKSRFCGTLQYQPTPFHRSCSGLTRDAAAAAFARNIWICSQCTTTPPQLRQGPLQTNRFVSEPANRVSQSALRILQWNADGLSTKVHELRQRLLSDPGNVAHLQRPDTGLPGLLSHTPRPPRITPRRRATHLGESRHSVSKNC